MKRFLLSLVALAGILGAAHAVNITGSNTANQNQIVSVGYERLSVTNAITAAAGGGATNAVLLTSAFNRVTVVASAGDSVKLPACVAGAANAGMSNTVGVWIWVANADSTDSMDVFPATGDGINALTVTTGQFAILAGKSAMFVCGVAGTWNTLLSG